MNFPSEYINLLRNKITVDEIIPIVYQIIINWNSPKAETDTYEMFLKPYITKSEAKWFKNNCDNGKLKKHDLKGFDVTFLSEILAIVSTDKIMKSGDPKFKNFIANNKLSMEYILNEIKNFRNVVAHEFDKNKGEALFKEMLEILTAKNVISTEEQIKLMSYLY